MDPRSSMSSLAAPVYFLVAVAIGAFDVGSFFYLKRESVDFVAARRQRNAPRYELGTTISWQDQSPAALFGWYRPEKTGTWSAGSAAALAVRLPVRPTTDLLLTAATSAFVNDLAPAVRYVEVFANGIPVATWQFDGGLTVERTAQIPLALIVDDRLVRVDFRFHQVQSPRDVGLSPDFRRLTMLLVEWRLDALSP